MHMWSDRVMLASHLSSLHSGCILEMHSLGLTAAVVERNWGLSELMS